MIALPFAQATDQFFTTPSIEVDLRELGVNMVIAAILAFILGKAYIRFGNSLSNRRMFANNFELLACTTMLIITVVKSSLALSLGLVGALSIVRFRSAIKEPEELAFLFLTIAIGLGLGAGQTAVTLVAFSIILLLIWVRGRLRKKEDHQNLYLVVSSQEPGEDSLNNVVGVLRKNCHDASLRRFEQRSGFLEAAFSVELERYEDLERSKNELRNIDDSLEISFVDHRGVV